MSARPYLFIGSSKEGLAVAEAIQAGLQHELECQVWNQGVFRPGLGALEAILNDAPRFDFAVLVLRGEDLTEVRGELHLAPRDNVMFELGIFMGGLGRERTFFVYSRDNPPKLPSDLAGITALTFAEPERGTLEAALGPACAEIKKEAKRLGLRQEKRLNKLDEATREVEGVGVKVEEMVRLLARSRKVELDIISHQFGPLIDKSFLDQMRADLEDLERSLRGEKAKGEDG